MKASWGLHGSLGLLLLAGVTLFSACGDDGNVLGSDGSAGSAGSTAQSGGGGGSGTGQAGGTSSAGTGQAGDMANAGTGPAGGTTSSGGSTGTGGADCKTGLCSRPYVCLDECGGTVRYTGCCFCPDSTIEQLTCDRAGGGGGGAGGSASADCVGETCASGESCVGYRTVGGAVPPAPDTNGMCPTGRHAEGNLCQPNYAYTCSALRGCSAPAATCYCATGSKCAQSNTCRLPNNESWVDGDADLLCEQQVP